MKGHALVMKMKDAGVPLKKSHVAALVAVAEMRAQFLLLYKGPDDIKQERLQDFEELEKTIKNLLPLPDDTGNKKTANEHLD
jgi:hypothetical protein